MPALLTREQLAARILQVLDQLEEADDDISISVSRLLSICAADVYDLDSENSDFEVMDIIIHICWDGTDGLEKKASLVVACCEIELVMAFLYLTSVGKIHVELARGMSRTDAEYEETDGVAVPESDNGRFHMGDDHPHEGTYLWRAYAFSNDVDYSDAADALIGYFDLDENDAYAWRFGYVNKTTENRTENTEN